MRSASRFYKLTVELSCLTLKIGSFVFYPGNFKKTMLKQYLMPVLIQLGMITTAGLFIHPALKFRYTCFADDYHLGGFRINFHK